MVHFRSNAASRPEHTARCLVPAFKRIEALDAVRGVAALIVVFHHCHLTLPDMPGVDLGIARSPFRLMVMGQPPVIMFFVLSGFVLTLSLASPHTRSIKVFLLRRFCRIWLPFAASILAATLLVLAIQPVWVEGVGSWFDDKVWSVAITPSLVISHLFMLGTTESITLNNPMWSLVFELRIALFIPIIFILARKNAQIFMVLILLFLSYDVYAAWVNFFGMNVYTSEDTRGAFLLSGYYLLYFLFGMLLAMKREVLVRGVKEVSLFVYVFLWLVAYVALSTRWALLNGAGASLVILLVLASPRLEKALSKALPQWLGRVSYSLYLVHVPVLAAMVHLLHDVWPLGAILACAVVISLLAAQVFYVLVEKPAIALGRRITAPAAAAM